MSGYINRCGNINLEKIEVEYNDEKYTVEYGNYGIETIEDRIHWDKVRYWWTEDGVAEVCEREECILEEETECYHCMSKLEKGTRSTMLTSLNDNEKYILCVTCADKSTKTI